MEKLSPITDPESLLDLAWDQIKQACTTRRHPFHTPTLATVSDRGPEARSVILRYASPKDWELRANADVRSPKARELRVDARSTWLFYSFPDHLQVRCYGRTHVHHLDEIAEKAWHHSQLLSRRCYLAPLPPSTELSDPHSNIPPDLSGREPTSEEAEPGFQNFSVLRCEIEEIDVLALRYEGNVRIRARRHSAPTWTAP